MPKKSNKSERSKKKKTLIREIIEVVILIFLLWILVGQAARALRRTAIGQIAKLTNTKITTDSAKFSFNGSIFIKGLVIKPKEEEKDSKEKKEPEEEKEYDDTILKAETVDAHFSITSLLLLKPRLKKISIHDFVFNAQRDMDTRKWNIGSLKIHPPGGSGQMPLINLKAGMLRYSKVSKGQIKVAAEIPLDARFELDEKTKNGYSFSLVTARSGHLGKSILTGFWQPGSVLLGGSISLEDSPDLEKVWTVGALAAEFTYDRKNNYSLKLAVKDLINKHEPVEEIAAFEEAPFLNKLGPFVVLQKFLKQYRPWGRIDLDFSAEGNLSQLGKSKLTGNVFCKDVLVCNKKFPYPMDRLNGQIDFTGKKVLVNNLIGWHGDVKLGINGWVKHFGDEKEYNFQITSDNMKLDEDLYAALKPQHKKMWDNFLLNGTVAINYNLSGDKGNKKRALAVKLLDTNATYLNFPYPLKNLHGTLLFANDSITLTNVESQNDGSKITIAGNFTDYSTTRPIHNISIKAKNLSLDHIAKGKLNDKLLELSDISLKKILADLQWQGNVDLDINLNNYRTDTQLDYKITIGCLNNAVNSKHFTYPLKDITGDITISRDNIKLTNLVAKPADSIHIAPKTSIIKVDGEIAMVNDGFRNGQFSLLADNITFDQRLGIALKGQLRDYYQKLAPTGQFGLDLPKIKIFEDAQGDRCVDFGGKIIFKGSNFSISPTVTDANFVLETEGLYDFGQGFKKAKGRLGPGSVRVSGKLLSELKADVYYEPKQRRWFTENFVADCYNGRVAGKFELKQSDDISIEYSLGVGLDDVDLKHFLLDSKNKERFGQDCTTGKMAASLDLAGQTGDSSSRIGRCRIQIIDMRIGKLSPIANLLGVLKLTAPSDYAFDKMFIDSYVTQDKLLLKKIDMSGKSVAFNGEGQLNLENDDIDLKLTARGPRLATDEPSVLQSLTDALGVAVVRMNVSGKIYAPEVKMTVLPVIKGTLQLLGTKQD